MQMDNDPKLKTSDIYLFMWLRTDIYLLLYFCFWHYDYNTTEPKKNILFITITPSLNTKQSNNTNIKKLYIKYY